MSIISDMRDAFHKPYEKKDHTPYKAQYKKSGYTKEF